MDPGGGGREDGLQAGCVQEIERPKTNMTLAVLMDLAAARGVHPRSLLSEAEMKPSKPGRPRQGRPR